MNDGAIAGVGNNDLGLDRGQLGNSRIVYFTKRGNKILLIQPNLRYVSNSSNYLENKISYKKYWKLNDQFIGAVKTQFGSINGYGGKYAPVDKMFNIGGKNIDLFINLEKMN